MAYSVNQGFVMLTIRLLLTLALLLPSFAAAYDFKGISIGQTATPAQITEKLGVKCDEGHKGLQVCNGMVTIAREDVMMNLVISPQGIVQRINLSLSPDAFDTVAQLLIEKFGPTTTSNRSKVQNRMGAKFDQVELFWEDKNGNQVLYSRYAGMIDQSSLSFTTKEDREMLKRIKGDPRADI
jgi:hypothetical protein